MHQIHIGDIQFSSTGEGLVIDRDDAKFKPITLNCDAVLELIEFVTSLSGDESNRRRTHRVNVKAGSDLKCRVASDGRTFDAVVKNISNSGALIELSVDSNCELSPESEIGLSLTFGEVAETVRAVVTRRQKGTQYGLYFPGCLKGDQVQPDPKLNRIVTQLQRDWLSGGQA